MIETIVASIFKVAGVLGVLTTISGWVVYRYRKNFTREVFFFCYLLAFTCFGLLSIGIFYDPLIFTQVFTFLTWDSNLPIGTTAGYLGLIIIWIVLLFSGFVIFKDWDGKKSLLQYQEEIGDRNQDIETIAKAIFFRDPALKTWQGFEQETITPLIPHSTFQEKPWFIHAAELLMLVDNQINIGLAKTLGQPNNDWYPDKQCYIATYGKQEVLLGVLCIEQEPSFGQVEEFSQFVQQTAEGQPYKLIVAVGDEAKKPREIINLFGPIEFRYKAELIETLFLHFYKYQEHIIRQYENNQIEISSPTTIKDIYVAPTGKQFARKLEAKEHTEKPIADIETYLKTWLADDATEDKKQIALLGEYGQGKSVMSLRLAYTILKEAVIPNRLPIIIELRGASPRSFRSQLEFLSVWAVNHDILPKIVLKLHELGRLLLIFEGFDEMDLVGNYEVRLHHFQKIWSFAHPTAKIIITGRPNFFLNDRELSTLLRTHRDVPNLPYCEEVHLNMFDLPQIEQALRYKPIATQKEIMTLLQASPANSGFRDLMQRPTLLFIAGTIWESAQLQEKGHQINSAFIMERFLEYSYKRQTDKLYQYDHNANSKPILEVEERAYFMMGIAVAMSQKKGYTNQIKQIDLNEAVLHLINHFDPIITKSAQQRFFQSSFAERVKGQEARKTVLRDVIACGVLVRDFSGEDLFKFAHKSFLEYLVSRFYVSLLLFNKRPNRHQLIAQTITKAFGTDLLAINHTSDTARFTGELLVNDANINSADYKENARKLFQYLYPVRWLDRFPEIAFPGFKAFFWGIFFGGLVAIFATILSTIIHPLLGIMVEILLFMTLFLFGVRLWFRIGEFIGILVFGLTAITFIENLFNINLSGDFMQLLAIMGEEDVQQSENLEGLFFYVCTLVPAFLFAKFYLVKPTSNNRWNLIAFENKQIDKFLQLWVIACKGIGVPDDYLLKFMGKRKLEELRKINTD